MPHTAMVQDFVQKLDNFYELIDENKTVKSNGDLPNLHLSQSSNGDSELTQGQSDAFEGQADESVEVTSERHDLDTDVVSMETVVVKKNRDPGERCTCTYAVIG